MADVHPPAPPCSGAAGPFVPGRPDPAGSGPKVGPPRWKVDADRCAWQQIGDRIVVLDLTVSVYFELNPAASALWPRLVAGTDRTELIDVLSRPTTGVDGRTRLGRQVDGFLDQLAAAELLSRPPSDGSAG